MSERPLPDLADGTIRLRAMEERDIPSVTEACQDPEIARWTMVPSPYTEASAREFLSESRSRWRAGEELSLVVADRRSDEVLGAVAIHRVDDPHGVGEVGYWVKREARGRGVATGAVRLISSWAFAGLGLSRLELLAAVENTPSRRVAERAGFTLEATLRSRLAAKEGRLDAALYSLLPHDLEPGSRPPRS